MSTSYYQTSVPSLLPTPLPTPLPTALPSLTFQPSFLDCDAGFGVFDGGGPGCAACATSARTASARRTAPSATRAARRATSATSSCRGVVPPGPASADEIDAWAPGRFRDGDDAALADVDLGA